MGWARIGHQAGLAHLLRDVQYAIDAGDLSLAPGINNLLKQAVAFGHRRNRLAASTLAVYAAKLEAKLAGMTTVFNAGSSRRRRPRC